MAAHLVARSGNDPRILVAFPAGNSGVGVWFSHLQQPARWEVVEAPQPGTWPDAKGRALYGISARVLIRAPELRIAQAVLSSVRVLRDYQALGTVPARVAVAPTVEQGRRIRWARDRIDGAPGYRLDLEVVAGDLQGERITAATDGTIGLSITAASGEPPLTPLFGRSLLNDAAPADRAARNALTFLSYQEKFLAGSWRFNTYFGRDTLMSVRLLMPVLTAEAVDDGLLAVLRRLSDQGEVAHEEDIGEFAILDHLQGGGSMSDAPVFNYSMIDGDYMLAPIASAWLLDDARGRQVAATLLSGGDGRVGEHPTRTGDDLVANLRFVLSGAAAFAKDPQVSNLVGLKPGRTAGQWRDSDNGLAGGRYPYDVNAALVPAALEAAGRLFASGLLDPYLAEQERPLFSQAADMAKVWRERAPRLFEVQVPHAAAVEAIGAYSARLGVPAPPALAALGAGDARFHAVALDASGSPVPVMHSDEGFALLFGQPDAQGLRRAVELLIRPFPAGLMTGAGMVVANPVFCSPDVQAKLTRSAYHGTVIWSWQQALFAAGLERQLKRRDIPAEIRSQLLQARKILWSAIDASRPMSNSELWSWSYSGGRYRMAPFGAAATDADESNAVQLWSTVYLAVRPGG
ncbi:MAG TPA: hypothetical protein VH183_00720 [Burkholderiaceae bacterium]|nr:hypothetical protein [Burkholderiaceae bacterium]